MVHVSEQTATAVVGDGVDYTAAGKSQLFYDLKNPP